MAAPSFISRNTIDIKMRNIVGLSKPNIDIALNGGGGAHSSYVSSYSTMDKIEGTVSITAKNDTRFDNVEIAFVGTAKTFVDKLSTAATASGRTEATHRFLKLTQPIDESSFPQPRIAEAGRTYRFPFTFVVPQQLLPRSCSHKVKNSQVEQAHLQLPPSLGDPELAGFGGTLLDDLAPEMAKISYAIKVRVTRTRESDGTELVLTEKARKVRVKPAFDEQPPLNVDEKDDEYRLRQEKTIKKGIFSGKLGRLVMEAAQPKSFHLPSTSPGGTIPPVSTVARIMLRFDPADESNPPPRLGSLSSKLKVSTFFASTPRTALPTKATSFIDASQGFHVTTLPLSSRCMASVQWEKHSSSSSSPDSSSPALSRRDSAVSISTTPAPSTAYAGRSFYTAELLVPLALPTSKHLVPTFHSCLVSRVYALGLTLSLHAPGVTAPSVGLKLPVQVSAEGSVAGSEARRSSRQAELVEMEVGEVFEPRSVAPPAQEFLGRSVIGAPPVYEVFDLAGAGRVSVCG